MNKKIPVLLIIFNRPQITERLIDALRKIKPEILYIAADGPRENKIGEKKLCEQTREVIKQIDWPCEIHTLFQEKNLGCKYGPIKAMDWFFENVDEGIILEDDCLPDPSFFTFCSELLDYYKNNPRIMHISGNNFQDTILRGDKISSYYFSKYTHSWGWATWKRSWKKFHTALNDFKKFDENNLIKKIEIEKDAQRFWIKNFRQTIKGNDSWDSLWMYTVWYNNGFAILPQKNLIKNIGFGEDATHTKEKEFKLTLELNSIDKIIHSDSIKLDREADDYTFKILYKTNLIKRIYLKIKKICKI